MGMPTNAQEYTGPIIDMHIHAYTDALPLFGMTHPPTLRNLTYKGAANARELQEKVFQKFKEHRIVKAIVTNGQLWQNEAPETILIGRSNMLADSLKSLHASGKLDAIAEMSPFYQGILANDPSQEAYFELAQELGIPVGFHIFPGGPNYGIRLMPEMLGGMRVKNASPLQLEEILVKYPNLKLYIMHGAWPHTNQLKALMYAYPNVYVDIAVVNWIFPQEEFNAYLKELITAGFGDRIMYGSDQMIWPDVISEGIRSVNAAEFLSLEQKENIFYDNAAAFLGLSPEEIAKHKQQE